ncbi:MAG TPA: outer membrane protein transport protein [Gammaproteobacteria bacterium]|nr:outer membrane protein transport protein [Gammaproteobacteria bacterium]
MPKPILCGRRPGVPALAAAAGLLLGLAPAAGATGFQRFSLSTAGLGLANAMGADTENPSSMAYNPSALAFQEGTHFEAGFMRRYGQLENHSADTSPDTKFYTHDLYATYRGPASSWGAGLGVNRPFRMDSNWSGEFSSANAATRSELDLIDVNPTLAYKLRPDVAVALGGDYYRALDFTYSTVATPRHGSGDGWGGTAGIMFWREGWAIAATYKTGADLDMDGKNLNGNRFRLPARARIGLKWRPSLRWSVHLDAVRTSWSQFKGLEDAPGAPGEPEKDWKDTVGYRLGAVARLSDKMALRFGYSYDAGPKDNRTFDPRSASGNRHMIALGAGWEGDLLRFNLAYAYSIKAIKDVQGAAVPEYDGHNRTSAQFLMFSVGYSDW